VLNSSETSQYSAAKADVWSLGIMLFIMLTGKQPFNIAVAEDCPSYAGYLEHGLSFLGYAKGLSEEAVKLLEGMLNPNPELRLKMSEVSESAWLRGVQCSLAIPSKWCEVLGYDSASKEMSVGSSRSQLSSSSRWSSPMQDGDTANDMLVRTLGWLQLPAPKQRILEQVTDALEVLGVEYIVAQGEWSHLVKVEVPCDSGEDGSLGSDSPSTASSSSDAFPWARTHMAGHLNVQLEIISPRSSKSDFHVTRQSGSVLRFHSFYHDVRNQLASSNGWDETVGRYLRIPVVD
jgi:serine/threonine protein kinase